MKQNQIVLLADASEKVKGQFQRITEQLKLGLVVAENGQEALDIAAGQDIDIVVIRRDVAVLDALSFSVLLKQSTRAKEIPVIIICTDASTQERERFKDAGCSGCIEEPFSDKELIEVLKRWLP